MMNWSVIIEIICVALWLGLVIYRFFMNARDTKLLPLIFEGIEAAEAQEGLTGEEKYKYAVDYISRKAKESGIRYEITNIKSLIERLIDLTKHVNIK